MTQATTTMAHIHHCSLSPNRVHSIATSHDATFATVATTIHAK
jgi:hypothetical protein